MKLVTGDYQRKTDVSYVCSLSKKVRAGCYVVGTNLKPMVESMVDQFETDPELCKSLKATPEPGVKLMRQVDVRPEVGHPTVLLKVFMNWNHKIQAWHVMVEGADEMVFEEGEQNF